jgi:hypothetical protein
MGRTRSVTDESETERTREKNVFGGEGSERNPSSHLTTLCVQSSQLRVWRGRRVVVHVMANRLLHSKRRKKQMSEGTSCLDKLFFLLSYGAAPICPPFGPPQKRGEGVEIR